MGADEERTKPRILLRIAPLTFSLKLEPRHPYLDARVLSQTSRSEIRTGALTPFGL
jgi:hypothetical protein